MPRPGLLRRLFGLRPPPPLADGRLEALRRYAILLRLDGRMLPERERVRLIDAGYDEAQRRLIDAAVLAPHVVSHSLPRLVSGAVGR